MSNITRAAREDNARNDAARELHEAKQQLFNFLCKVADIDNPMEMTPGGLAVIRVKRADFEVMQAKLNQMHAEGWREE